MNKSSEKDGKIISIIVIVVAILIVTQTINNITKTMQMSDNNKIVSRSSVDYMSIPQGIGSATISMGTARFCINIPPIITYDCNLSDAVLDMNNTYNCTFNATDPNGDNIIFMTRWMTSPSIFNVTQSGYYNFSPKRAAMNKTNTVRIYAYDNSPCTNNYSYKEMNMTVIGVNRPPYLVKNIPDEKIVKDKFLIFSLDDYFADPDEDKLSYFYGTLSGETTKIRIIGNNVEIRGLSCGKSTAYFVAVDPFGLTATSNTITYEVTCPDQSLDAAGGDNKTGGSGNGGGGSQRICVPSWRCGKWSQCQPWNSTYKRCIDYNACNPNHYEQYLYENCTYMPEPHYCTENWDCNEWSKCTDDIHTRICLDLDTCGTNSTKPAESENCSRIASCFNGIQDPGETGVDCGGSCGACRNLEQPAKTSNLGTIVLLIAGLTFGTIGFFAYVFRAKIIAIYKKIFTRRVRIRHKIYINNKQKEKLLQMLNIIQARLDEHKINHAIDESSLFIKEYFKQLVSIDNLTKQELITNIIKLKDKDLEKILVMFYAKTINMVHIRNRGAEIKESEIQALIDEMSNEIYLIAEFTDQEAVASAKNRTTESKESLNIIYTKLSNLYIALKFGELLLAKKMYKDIMKDYNQLSTKDKSIPYTDIIRAFHAIYYLETQYTK